MPIIKEQQITENTWTFVDDDSALPDGNITVSLKRWNENKEQLLSRDSGIGIRLNPGDSTDAIRQEDLAAISLVELNFPVFTDGRLFSQAQQLRSRDGYTGEIRAVGHFMADQVFYLQRVGVDAFEFSEAKEMEYALSALKDFSVRYQTSVN